VHRFRILGIYVLLVAMLQVLAALYVAALRTATELP
jgi:hypothetical protein